MLWLLVILLTASLLALALPTYLADSSDILGSVSTLEA